jgi:hypothetical protein
MANRFFGPFACFELRINLAIENNSFIVCNTVETCAINSKHRQVRKCEHGDTVENFLDSLFNDNSSVIKFVRTMEFGGWSVVDEDDISIYCKVTYFSNHKNNINVLMLTNDQRKQQQKLVCEIVSTGLLIPAFYFVTI